MIKAIIFDCFSVLIGDASKAAAAELWHNNPEKGDEYRAVSRASDAGILDEEESLELHARLLGMSKESLRDLRNKGEVRNVELITYIENSLQGTYKLALLSNISSRARLDIRFLPGELDRIFDVVIPSGEVGYIKPQPEIFELTAHQLGVLPGECVMIDDIAEFCDGARAAGMHAIQFINNQQAIAELISVIDRGGQGD